MWISILTHSLPRGATLLDGGCSNGGALQELWRGWYVICSSERGNLSCCWLQWVAEGRNAIFANFYILFELGPFRRIYDVHCARRIFMSYSGRLARQWTRTTTRTTVLVISLPNNQTFPGEGTGSEERVKEEMMFPFTFPWHATIVGSHYSCNLGGFPRDLHSYFIVP